MFVVIIINYIEIDEGVEKGEVIVLGHLESSLKKLNHIFKL